MKKYISISFVALSSLVLILLALVPHHHHQGLVCVVMEICEQDNQVNDQHTSHGELPDDNAHEQMCIADSEYTAPKADEKKCNLPSCHNHDFNHFFPIFFLAADILAFDTGTSLSDYKFGEYILTYKSAEANQFHGLRAPPFSFC